MSKTRSAKPDTNVSFRTSIGGQALIEGILMRGPEKQAIVCRTEDGLVEKVDELHLVKEKAPDPRLGRSSAAWSCFLTRWSRACRR